MENKDNYISDSKKTNITVFTPSKKSLKVLVYNAFNKISLSHKLFTYGTPTLFVIMFPHLVLNLAFFTSAIAFVGLNYAARLTYNEAETDTSFINREHKISSALFKKELREKLCEVNSNIALKENDYRKIYEVFNLKRKSHRAGNVIFTSNEASKGSLSISVDRSSDFKEAFKSALEIEKKTNTEGVDNETLSEAKKKVISNLEITEGIGNRESRENTQKELKDVEIRIEQLYSEEEDYYFGCSSNLYERLDKLKKRKNNLIEVIMLQNLVSKNQVSSNNMKVKSRLQI